MDGRMDGSLMADSWCTCQLWRACAGCSKAITASRVLFRRMRLSPCRHVGREVPVTVGPGSLVWVLQQQERPASHPKALACEWNYISERVFLF